MEINYEGVSLCLSRKHMRENHRFEIHKATLIKYVYQVLENKNKKLDSILFRRKLQYLTNFLQYPLILKTI